MQRHLILRVSGWTHFVEKGRESLKIIKRVCCIIILSACTLVWGEPEYQEYFLMGILMYPSDISVCKYREQLRYKSPKKSVINYMNQDLEIIIIIWQILYLASPRTFTNTVHGVHSYRRCKRNRKIGICPPCMFDIGAAKFSSRRHLQLRLKNLRAYQRVP